MRHAIGHASWTARECLGFGWVRSSVCRLTNNDSAQVFRRSAIRTRVAVQIGFIAVFARALDGIFLPPCA
jgi:hypothetical protein